jgi:hypothetical protein
MTEFVSLDSDAPDSAPADHEVEQAADVVAEMAPVRALPDRADAPVSEVTERFLRAVIAQVPLERIEELHLFSPLRQGTVETGIAVLAAREIVVVPEPVEPPAPELPFHLEPTDDVHLADAMIVDDPDAAVDADEADYPVDAVVVDAEVLAVTDADVSDASDASDAVDLLDAADAPDALDMEVLVALEAADEESPYADDVALADAGVMDADADEADVEDVSADDTLAADASDDELLEAAAVHVDDDAAERVIAARKVLRHTVYSARYRLVIKGPERGKWESDVKAEAEAPLITVETVVRGVQRRAGEESEIVRYSAAQIAKALRIPLPAQ